ncbi:MAG: thymidylate synthase, partial [Thermoprotei archaeon]|nr:thymidylate synthase [Thermoprotei archaeon]
MRLNIKILNPKSNIAICTLWGKKEVILNMLGNDKDKVSIIGTLYTTYGINYLIRTLAKYNRIDTLIVFGPDLSKSGEALVRLFSEKEIPKGLKLVWKLEQIRDILDSVRIIDLRSVFGRNGCKDVLREVVRRNFKPDIV